MICPKCIVPGCVLSILSLVVFYPSNSVPIDRPNPRLDLPAGHQINHQSLQEKNTDQKPPRLFMLEQQVSRLEKKNEWTQAIDAQKQVIQYLDKNLKPQVAFNKKLAELDHVAWLYLESQNIDRAIEVFRQQVKLCQQHRAKKRLLQDVESQLQRVLAIAKLDENKQKSIAAAARALRLVELNLKNRKYRRTGLKNIQQAERTVKEILGQDHPLLAKIQWVKLRLELEISVQNGPQKYAELLRTWKNKIGGTRLYAAMQERAGRFFLLINSLQNSADSTVAAIKGFKQLYATTCESSAWASMTLADLYSIQGRLGNAMHFYRQANCYFESLYGPGTPGQILATDGLADLSYKFSKITEFREYISKISADLKRYENVQVPPTDRYDLNRERLASLRKHVRLHNYHGEFKQALKFAQQAYQLSESIHGKRGRSHADYVRLLGNAELKAGQLEQGLQHAKLALRIRNSTNFSQMKDIGLSRFLVDVGLGYQFNGDYEKAVEYFTKALNHQKEIGESPGRMAQIEFQIGFNLLLLQDKRCEDFFCRAADKVFVDSYQDLSILNEPLAVSMVNRLKNCMSGIFLVDVATNSEKTNRQTLEYLWRIKGTATEAIVYRTRLMNSNPGIQNEFKSLTKAIAEIALRKNANPKLLNDLLNRKDRLLMKMQSEDQWSSLLFRPLDHRAEIAELTRKLPDDVAIVDISKQLFWEKPKSGKGHVPTMIYYYAYIIRKDPAAKDKLITKTVVLSESHLVDDAIQKFRRQLAAESYTYLKKHKKKLASRTVYDMKSVVKPANNEHLSNLKKHIWDNIEKNIGDCKTLVICPGGEFTRFPWGALPRDVKKMSKRLAEDYRFVNASSPRAVLRTLNNKPSENEYELLTIADGKYRKAKSNTKPQARNLHEYLLSARNFYDLPGSKREADVVRRIFQKLGKQKSTALSGLNVNRKQVTELVPKAKYVHIATHGFHFDPIELRQKAGKLKNPNLQRQLIDFIRSLERNPFLASGIALSIDAKQNNSTCDFLTAEELLALNLQKINLLVLSSCDSSLGRINRGEGVFGIQSAILFAGAKSCLASSWKVDDEYATEFMKEFYRQHLIHRKSKAESLRLAQTKMIKMKLPPLFWANWTLQGDWR